MNLLLCLEASSRADFAEDELDSMQLCARSAASNRKGIDPLGKMVLALVSLMATSDRGRGRAEGNQADWIHAAP